LAKSNLNDEELFLMNGFKNMFSSRLVALISEWLNDKFMIIYQANSMRIMRNSGIVPLLNYSPIDIKMPCLFFAP